MAGNSELKSLGGAGHCDEVPHFVMEVRPSSIPPALLRLPDDVHVTYESWSKRWQGRSVARAHQLREQIMETMTRQREGYFTLDEAAQIIADSRPAVDPAQAVKRFLSAHQKGHLTIHQGGTRFRREVNEAVSDFHDVLEAGALDKWLRESTGFGFPTHSVPAVAPLDAKAAASSAPPVAHASTVRSTKGRRPSDTLWPAIRKAQEQCVNQWDAAEVFGRLQALADATESYPPLVESTRNGISWTNEKGVVTFLDRGALSKRLRRLARAGSRR
jgi:hypothetical protein